MLLQESKIRVLENFYALDYVFFGKPVSEVESCCPLVKEEYLSIKGALMSVFVEMLKLVDHNPNALSEKVNSKALYKYARQSARIARENAERIVTTDKSRKAIKESLKQMVKEDDNIDISIIIESQIRQKAFSYAVDNLLLSRVVSESNSFDKLNEWQGKIIEDSYKILRDNLIESAYEIIYSDDYMLEEDTKKKVIEAKIEEEIGYGAGVPLGALIGLLTPLPGGMITGASLGALSVWIRKNREKVKSYCERKYGKDASKKAACMKAGINAIKIKAEKAREKAQAKKQK